MVSFGRQGEPSDEHEFVLCVRCAREARKRRQEEPASAESLTREELIAMLDRFAHAFAEFPILIGTSRKSFIGRLLDGAPAAERLHGTMAPVAAAVLGGAHIVRAHDVKAAVETVRVIDAIKSARRPN